MDILEKMEIALDEAFTVEEFDEVKEKGSKKLYKVVEIEKSGSVRTFILKSLEKGNKDKEGLRVVDKEFFKKYEEA